MSIQPLRHTFTTSRQLDFFSEDELSKQTGHARAQWPRVILKELIDNALDACEEHDTPPEIEVRCDATSIEVSDDGPGIPAETVVRMVDFGTRTSSRAAYVAPDRGAQGNALKTLIGIAHVLGGRLLIRSHGILHSIGVEVDAIQQVPSIGHLQSDVGQTSGTLVRIEWPSRESGTWPMGDADLNEERAEIWWLIFGYAAINPHLTIDFKWFGKPAYSHVCLDDTWNKWKPSQPTSAHWYSHADLVRLAAAYVSSDKDMLVRDFVALFDGLARTAKRKAVLDAAGLHRAKLSDLLMSGSEAEGLDRLLGAMKKHCTPIKPKALGLIGREHLTDLLMVNGGADSVRYKKTEGFHNGLPYVLEMGFARLEWLNATQFLSGANFSAGINDLFARTRGWIDDLSDDDPVLIFTHIVCPKLTFADRGKSSLIL